MNKNTVSSRVLRGVFFAVLLSGSGLASCSDGGGGNSKVTTSPSTFTGTISAGSTSIAYNTFTTITWSSINSSPCTFSGDGSIDTAGSFTTPRLTTTTTYTLTCGSASQDLTITVASKAVSSAITGFASGGVGIVTVTSLNALIPGAIITISGTTSYNGTYTVASQTLTSFTIAATFGTSETSGIWQVAGGMIPGCLPSGDTGFITLSNVPNRFTGVAPLSVFFDASGTMATSAPQPFHDLEYRWNFGDPAGSPVSGTTWKAGSGWDAGNLVGVNSRNSATGPVASHVFETPGVYTVALSATDGTNTVSNSCTQIVVQNPDDVFAGSNTTCVGATTLPVQGVGGCPAGANTILQPNFATAINTYALTGKRVLLKRGDTFTATSSARINRTGPGIVGAFGSALAAAPIVQMTGNATIIQLSSSSTPDINDWRVMDLDLNGMSGNNTIGVNADGSFKQLLLLRLNVHHVKSGILATGSILNWWNNHGSPGHTIYEDWSIVDSVSTPIPGGCAGCDWRIFLAGIRNTIQGNRLDNMTTGGSHVIRSSYMNKGVIANNDIANAGATQENIKLHAPGWAATGVTSPGTYTEQVVIADNKFISSGNQWVLYLGPQDNTQDERVRDVVVERNWFTTSGGTTVAQVRMGSSNTTLRNNIFNLTGANSHAGIQITRWGGSGQMTPDNDHVYNNTFYSNDAGSFGGINIDSVSTNVRIINNLGSAPLATNPVIYSGTGASGFFQSNNLMNNTPSAVFVNATPVKPADFKLAVSSPARDAGASGISVVQVFSDFFLTSRPQNSVTDVGAVEGP